MLYYKTILNMYTGVITIAYKIFLYLIVRKKQRIGC